MQITLGEAVFQKCHWQPRQAQWLRQELETISNVEKVKSKQVYECFYYKAALL